MSVDGLEHTLRLTLRGVQGTRVRVEFIGVRLTPRRICPTTSLRFRVSPLSEEDRPVSTVCYAIAGSYWPSAMEGCGDASVNAKRSSRRCHGEAVHERKTERERARARGSSRKLASCCNVERRRIRLTEPVRSLSRLWLDSTEIVVRSVSRRLAPESNVPVCCGTRTCVRRAIRSSSFVGSVAAVRFVVVRRPSSSLPPSPLRVVYTAPCVSDKLVHARARARALGVCVYVCVCICVRLARSIVAQRYFRVRRRVSCNVRYHHRVCMIIPCVSVYCVCVCAVYPLWWWWLPCAVAAVV